MPAFQKIGGLLTNNAMDATTLHDSVIAINQAVIDNVYLFPKFCLQNNFAW